MCPFILVQLINESMLVALTAMVLTSAPVPRPLQTKIKHVQIIQHLLDIRVMQNWLHVSETTFLNNE